MAPITARSTGPSASFSTVADALDAERRARRVGGATPVNPALARMHERLRARRPLNASDVPAVASSRLSNESVKAAVAAAPALAEDVTPAAAPGLERFMRLRGLSDRTYVFSRIEPRHISLYRNGIFAWVAKGGEKAGQATVIGDVLPIMSKAVEDGALYVHLLAQDDGDRAEVLTDLQ